ncbi:hypothetical protein [Rhodoferax sp.]|nr:hypothetical protein [Rhodoferax sp.]MDR3367665.1 hypothetical protein [Rhodoferax sp.]
MQTIDDVFGEANDLSDDHRYGAHGYPSTLKVLRQIGKRGQSV